MYDPQSLATPLHAESSAMSVWVPHIESTQVASSRVPWQVACESQFGGSDHEPEQSSGRLQQSPVAQQKPFWQWSDLHSSSSLHCSPSSRSSMHSRGAASRQKPSASHWLSSVQLVGQA